MTPFPWSDVAIIAVLILLNGVFAMSELAIVSARGPRLQAAEKRGSRGAAIARKLGSDPGRFLSTVQIGITLIGILAGAYSGASLGGPVGERLQALFGLDDETAQTAGFARGHRGHHLFLADRRASWCPSSSRCAPPSRSPSSWRRRCSGCRKSTAPLVWLLDRSSALMFRLLGLNRESEDQVTAEELHLIVAEASKSGVIEESERAIISGVVRLADRPVREVMTPRTDVDWIDIASDADDDARASCWKPRTPACRSREGSVDAIVGVVQARDIAAALFRGETLDLERLTRSAPVIHDQIDAMDALEASARRRRADAVRP